LPTPSEFSPTARCALPAGTRRRSRALSRTYVRAARFNDRKLQDLVDEYEDVRQASLALFRSLEADAWLRRGVASNNPVTVLALAYLIAGNELHHRNVLTEMYFPAIPRA